MLVLYLSWIFSGNNGELEPNVKGHCLAEDSHERTLRLFGIVKVRTKHLNCEGFLIFKKPPVAYVLY